MHGISVAIGIALDPFTRKKLGVAVPSALLTVVSGLAPRSRNSPRWRKYEVRAEERRLESLCLFN